MSADLVLAIDLGSSWCKAAYLDRRGSIVAEGRIYSRTITDHSELMLERFWNVVTQAVRLAGAALGETPRPGAVGISCRGLFGICFDQQGHAFIPSYDVLSTKSAPEVAVAFRSSVWGEGGPYAFGYAVRLAGLIAGLRKASPKEWQRISRVGALHTYIVYRLSGQWVTDPTTGPSSLEWPTGLLDLSGLSAAAFPVILDPWAIAGNLTVAAAAELGLPINVPIVAGLHDGAAANIGTGTVYPGDTCLTLGTNFAVRAVSGDRLQANCFGYIVAPNQWAWVNSVPKVATQLDLVATVLMETPVELSVQHRFLADRAASIAPGARLPLLPLGNDAELLDAVRRASDSGYSDGEIYLAMLYMAAAGLHGLVNDARRDGAHPTRFVATGGGARNTLLLNILATMLGTSIEVGHPEAGMLGAGMVAAIGGGWYTTLAEAWSAMSPLTGTVHPGPNVAASA